MDLFLLYAICAGAGFLFLLGTAVFGEFFGHDLDVAGTDMPGAGVLSPMTIAAFVTAFGGFGLIFGSIEATQHPLVSAVLSGVSGVIVAGLVVAGLRAIFRRTQSSSEPHVAAVVGIEANVITPIPANGVGEIAYVQNGSRYSAPAREQNGNQVSSGKAVRIVRVVGTQFYVSLETDVLAGGVKNPT